jgi:Rha family phage regulatory protein
MNELIYLKNDEAVTTSLQVAEFFHKRHDRVLRAIDNLLEGLPKNGVVKFNVSQYKDAKGEKRKMYYMNRDGFSLLAMGFTGQKALEWKLKYIEAFNRMESYINFRKADKQIQKNSMQFLHDNLEMPTPKDYMKANTIANKCVSIMHGYEKMVKKADMTVDMLTDREEVLKGTVELMAVRDKYDLDIPVSENIYKKYAQS